MFLLRNRERNRRKLLVSTSRVGYIFRDHENRTDVIGASARRITAPAYSRRVCPPTVTRAAYTQRYTRPRAWTYTRTGRLFNSTEWKAPLSRRYACKAGGRRFVSHTSRANIQARIYANAKESAKKRTVKVADGVTAQRFTNVRGEECMRNAHV